MEMDLDTDLLFWILLIVKKDVFNKCCGKSCIAIALVLFSESEDSTAAQQYLW